MRAIWAYRRDAPGAYRVPLYVVGPFWAVLPYVGVRWVSQRALAWEHRLWQRLAYAEGGVTAGRTRTE